MEAMRQAPDSPVRFKRLLADPACLAGQKVHSYHQGYKFLVQRWVSALPSNLKQHEQDGTSAGLGGGFHYLLSFGTRMSHHQELKSLEDGFEGIVLSTCKCQYTGIEIMCLVRDRKQHFLLFLRDSGIDDLLNPTVDLLRERCMHETSLTALGLVCKRDRRFMCGLRRCVGSG